MQDIIKIILFLLIMNGSHSVFASYPMGNVHPTISKDDVKKAVKKKFKGRIISIKSQPSVNFPDCHIVKMSLPEGGIRYIRYACK